MPTDLSQVLVIGVSSRALFDLEEANRVYETEGLDAYIQYQVDRADDVLGPGAGFPLIRSILDLNRHTAPRRVAEVVIMSRNSPQTSLRMFNSIQHYGLDIQHAALSGGTSIAPYLHTFDVDLFLSASEIDVQAANAAGVAGGLILGKPASLERVDPIRIGFDADAVIFSDEAERIYRERGLEAFLKHEKENAKRPLPDGPFAKLLRTLSELQCHPSFAKPPIRLAVITARNMPAHERVIRTLLAWNVRVDEAFFMGGIPKTRILQAFQPHIFFDDQDTHCQPAAQLVPTAKVSVVVAAAQNSAPPARGHRRKRKDSASGILPSACSSSSSPAPVLLLTRMIGTFEGSTRSSVVRACAAVCSAPGRSALCTTTMSATSRRPAFSHCSSSPLSG
jgi:5'-nucleotidase